MSDYRIVPRPLAGAVTPPPSKSLLHRLLIADALAGEDLPVVCRGEGEDIAATRRCLIELLTSGERLPTLDCGESGSTLRFLIPLALVLRGGAVFVGHGRLMERPLRPYLESFDPDEVEWSLEGDLLTVEGTLSAGTYRLPGNLSSQFITGLLFALPLLEGESRIELTAPLESRPYVELTLAVLKDFKVEVDVKENSFIVDGPQEYKANEREPEADWSQGAFWYAANFLEQKVEVRGLDPDSVQGDRQIARWYWSMARPGALELDLAQCPDLLPPAALMAAVRAGTTHFVGAGRLRDKESDRLAAVTRVLSALGAQVEEEPEGLVLHGPCRLRGGVTVDPAGDHRIAMMAAIAAAVCDAPVTILNGECVNKSYPSFWEDYRRLGGEFHVAVSGQ